jgi:hypothetical protein
MVQRISRGEADAVFQTGFTGGLHGRGAPDDPDQQVAIKPFFPDGRHYCVEDFHALLLGLAVDEANDGVSSVGDAKKLFAPTVMTFVLDGVPFETTRLPVKPIALDPPAKAFVLVQGRVVAPDELGAGSHTLTVTVENDPAVPEVQVFTSQFFIDAAGTGACI